MISFNSGREKVYSTHLSEPKRGNLVKILFTLFKIVARAFLTLESQEFSTFSKAFPVYLKINIFQRNHKYIIKIKLILLMATSTFE